MLRIRTDLLILACASLAAACLGGGDSRGGSPDAGSRPIDAGPGGSGGSDADVPAVFDRLELRISPDSPLPGFDFNLYLRAADTEGRLYQAYEGVVTIEASDGTLLGNTEDQQVTFGTAFIPLRFDEELEGVRLTVKDDAGQTYTSAPFDVAFEGEPASEGDVVISEVNWYGSPLDFFIGLQDSWIELRNVSDRELNISQWRLEGVGIQGQDVFLFSGTVLAPGDYVVVGNHGIFSLDGVAASQLHRFVVPLDLPAEGAQIVLRDVAGTLIDRTPDPSASGGWPAGAGDFDYFFFESMERRDDISGGGYGDGSDPGQWYTWNRGAGVDTTGASSFDQGTPGAHNSDPDAAMALPYETSFELKEPRFEFVSTTGQHIVSPAPEGTFARTGDSVISTDSIRTGFNLRRVRSVDCIALDNGDDLLRISIHGMAGDIEVDDDGAAPLADPLIRLRQVVEWYTDSRCEAAHATAESVGPSTILAIGEYVEVPFEIANIPAGATHIRVRLEPRIDEGDGDVHTWAGDDLRVEQLPDEESANHPDAA
jgi:hypothetical protein